MNISYRNNFNFYPFNNSQSVAQNLANEIITKDYIEDLNGVSHSNCQIRNIKNEHGCSKCDTRTKEFSSFTIKDEEEGNCLNCTSLQVTNLKLKKRGIEGCECCRGNGYFVTGLENIKVCSPCLRITGYCITCLDTGYKLGSSIRCDHRRT
jgi:hypothetical protein